MMDFVHLYLKRNRGWPSPEDSWGLTPMFGVDGWCRLCGLPLRDQCGPLTLRRTGMASPEGVWIPNWRFDAVCVSGQVATDLEAFDIELRPIAWVGRGGAPAWQLVLPSTEGRWFDPEQLRARTIARHGVDGEKCAGCGRWRWMPLPIAELPPFVGGEVLNGVEAAASPEWFGAGHQSFRKLLFRRDLAQLLAGASPKDFKIIEMV
jgi:hypothetical protein